eukprot:13652-Heterococcus_DN1.PRE.2
MDAAAALSDTLGHVSTVQQDCCKFLQLQQRYIYTAHYSHVANKGLQHRRGTRLQATAESTCAVAGLQLQEGYMIVSVQSLRLLQTTCRSSLHVAYYCYDCSGSSTASSRLQDSVCTERTCAAMKPEN